MKFKKTHNKKAIAFFEMSLMITAIIAFAFLMNVESVNATVPAVTSPPTTPLLTDSAKKSVGLLFTASAQPLTVTPPPLAVPVPSSINSLQPLETIGQLGFKTPMPPMEDLTPTSIPKTFSAEIGKIAGTKTLTAQEAQTIEKLLSSGATWEQITPEQKLIFDKIGVTDAARFNSVKTPPSLWTSAQAAGAGIVVGFIYSFAANLAVKFIGKLIDSKGKYTLETNAIAAGVSTWVGMTSSIGAYNAVIAEKGFGEVFAEGFGEIFSWGGYQPYVLAAAIIFTAYTYLTSEAKELKTETVQFKCMAWQAPVGGADCEKCNNDPKTPCSEYRCKSLGQGCGIINAGTAQEKCIWVNPHDTLSPGIKPWTDVLTANYEYKDIKERPPTGTEGASGMKIAKKGGGCIDAFTAITFGVLTSEPGQCKIDYKHTKSFDEMGYYIDSNTLYELNHSQAISLPGTKLLNSLYPEIQNDGNYNLYIRCRDGNGNVNRDEFAVSFCVDKGPDLTAPQIKSTSIANNAPVQYKVDNVSLGVYTNEPGQCKWSRQDSDYEVMENNMTCSNQVWQMNAEQLYTCATILTGIKDRQDNVFYFKCSDLSNNSMTHSYKFTLKGTQPLDIIKVGPNETVGGSTNAVSVNLHAETDNGYKNGESNCYYSTTGAVDSYIEFFKTGSNIHDQTFDLTEGSHKYYIKCVDLGGNFDNETTQFNVVVDKNTPMIIRAYNENDKIKVATNENSSCVYSSQSCNYDFDQGIKMTGDGNKIHYSEWKTGQSYYLKCSDDYGNMPITSECSIILRPAGS